MRHGVKRGIKFPVWKNSALTPWQSFGLSWWFLKGKKSFHYRWEDFLSSQYRQTTFFFCFFLTVLHLTIRLATLRVHSLFRLGFGRSCRGRWWSGGRGGRRRRTPSGLYAGARHLELPSLGKRSVVDTFQKEALPLTAVKSLVWEREDERTRSSHVPWGRPCDGVRRRTCSYTEIPCK